MKSIWKAKGLKIARVEVLRQKDHFKGQTVCRVKVTEILEGADNFNFITPLKIDDERWVVKDCLSEN